MTHHAHEDVEQEELSSIDGASANLHSHFTDQYGGSSKVENESTSRHTSEYILRMIHPIRDTCSAMFIAALFIISEYVNNPDIPQTWNGLKCDTLNTVD